MLEKLLKYKLWKEIIGDVLRLTPFVFTGFILTMYKINEYKGNKEMKVRNIKNQERERKENEKIKCVKRDNNL